MRIPYVVYVSAFISSSIMFPMVFILGGMKFSWVDDPLLIGYWATAGLGTVLGWGKDNGGR